MAKQTKVTYETDSLLILRGGYAQRAVCPSCGAEVDVIALEHTGMITNLEQPALEEWFASGEIHRLEAIDGSMLICLQSLLGRLQGQRPKPKP